MSDEEQVRALVEDVGDRMKNGDGEAACAEMTAQARRQFAAAGDELAQYDPDFAARRGDAKTCGEVLTVFLEGGNVIEDYSPKILSVDVKGDRAIVVGDSSHDESGKPQRLTLVRENGDWKVAKWFEN